MVRRHKRWYFYKDYAIEELIIYSAKDKKIGKQFEVRHDGSAGVFINLTAAKAYVRLVIESNKQTCKEGGK